MVPYKRAMIMPWAAATVGVVLAFGAVAAQDDEEAMASMAPLESTAPMETMEPGLYVHHAWTRQPMMMDLAGGAFMVIHNSTDADDALVGASTPAAEVVEIHQTTTAEDGTMAMAPVTEIPIPAHGEAVLEPGGYHVMLIDLVEPLEPGTEIELTLEFTNAVPQTLMVPVLAMGPMSDMGMDHSMDHED